MTSFIDKEIDSLKQCPICKKWTNLMIKDKYNCWNCNNQFKEREGK